VVFGPRNVTNRVAFPVTGDEDKTRKYPHATGEIHMSTPHNSKLRRAGLAAAAMLFPTAALAHPAIGPAAGFAHGFAHPLGGVDHVLAMVAVGLLAASLGGRALWALPLAFISLMVAGGALGTAGVPLPFVELAIALSVVVIGGAVATQRQWPVVAAAALVGIFALFHGHAHGTELTATMSAGAFTAGFVLATGLLHLIGIALWFGIAHLGPRPARLCGQLGGGAIALAGIALLVAG
jgi:urease accessory protein